MAAKFDPVNTIWAENLQDIALEEPYIYMNDEITFYIDKKGDISLLMPLHYDATFDAF